MAWDLDASVISGLGLAESTAFFNDGTPKLISVGSNTFTGFYWNGSTWVSDNSIITGLSISNTATSMTIYDDGGTWKILIGARLESLPAGYYWNGAAWVLDAAIISGITPIGGGFPYNAPCVFDDAGTLKLILCDMTGHWYGYYWSGSTWASDQSIISGIHNVTGGAPMVYQDTDWINLLGGEFPTEFTSDLRYTTGMVWDTEWIQDNAINYGITDVTWSVLNVFELGGTLTLIQSRASTGAIYGYGKSATNPSFSSSTDINTTRAALNLELIVRNE